MTDCHEDHLDLDNPVEFIDTTIAALEDTKRLLDSQTWPTPAHRQIFLAEALGILSMTMTVAGAYYLDQSQQTVSTIAGMN